MMDTFDYPQMGPNCLSRNVSTVSPQALMLMNNDRVYGLSIDFAERVRSIAAPDPESIVDTVYQLALSRMPTNQERQLGVTTLGTLRAEPSHPPDIALQTYCHTILNSASFLFVD